MQEPGALVQPHLREHVHLISTYNFGYIPQMQIDEAFRRLFEARDIIGRLAPMAWQYLDAPPDGTLFLEYCSTFLQNNFPSDGYVWTEEEEFEVHEIAGYTLEVAKRSAGLRPGHDQMANHARRRYRLLSKAPSVPSHPPDPQVWLVHYFQAEPNKVVPASNIKPEESTQRVLPERRWIESHGPLQRQEFMLHQRELWPQLQLPQRKASSPGQTAYPRGPVPQPPVAHPANPRFSGQHYQQQAPGQSPAKRQRQNPQPPPPQSAQSNTPQAQPYQPPDTTIEDEEDVTYGDILDQLTQRELSLTRYMQHHEWMEEIFSSPYATGQIIPMDLGFGLAGELSGITEGIFDTISKPQDAGGQYKKLQPQDLQELEKRISQHTKKVQAEIQEMRDSHSKAMADMKRSKALRRAERLLRSAGQIEIQSIAKDVETACGGRIVTAETESLVERGGLKEKVQPPPAQDTIMGGIQPVPADASSAAAAGAVDQPPPPAVGLQAVPGQQATPIPPPQQPLPDPVTPAPVADVQAVPSADVRPTSVQQDTEMLLDANDNVADTDGHTEAAAQRPTDTSQPVPAAPSAPAAAPSEAPRQEIPNVTQHAQTGATGSSPAIPSVPGPADVVSAGTPAAKIAAVDEAPVPVPLPATTTQADNPYAAAESSAAGDKTHGEAQDEGASTGLQGSVQDKSTSVSAAGIDVPAPVTGGSMDGLRNSEAASTNATSGVGTEGNAPPAL